MIQAIIKGYKWFDRINGNTYHSVVVTVTTAKGDVFTACSGFTYGYDDSYEQTALGMLVRGGYVAKGATIHTLLESNVDVRSSASYGLKRLLPEAQPWR
jgi:hypothetical protein